MRRSSSTHGPLLSAIAAGLAVLAATGLIVLWPSADPGPAAPALSSFDGVFAAVVERRTEQVCAGGEAGTVCVRAVFRLLAGPDAGDVVVVELPVDSGRAGPLTVGRRVLLGHQPGVEGFEYVYLDPDRRGPLLLLAGLFAAAVVMLGRWRGAAALAGLVATLLVLFLFVVPAILDGRDPLLVSLVGSVVIAYAALYLSHGLNVRTTVALLGTLGGLLCAAAFAALFMGVATISGVASEEALYLSAVGANIDVRGLILGGILIGALGAIDDMTVTQASAIWELRGADARIPVRQLMRAGMRIGRDHVASTVNTLVLAYAGASMPLLILFVLSDQPASTVANGEIVATEIVRTLVGSLGLVASVPITTWLSVRIVTGRGGGRHARSDRPPAREQEPEGPEEHPIPEHRRDVWLAWLGGSRSRRSR